MRGRKERIFSTILLHNKGGLLKPIKINNSLRALIRKCGNKIISGRTELNLNLTLVPTQIKW